MMSMIVGRNTLAKAVAVALMAAAAVSFVSPAVAQSRSLAPAGSLSGGAGLVNQVEMLRQQNSQLLGQIQSLQHQVTQLRELNKEQYQALDARVRKLEGKPPLQVNTGNTPATAGGAQATADATANQTPAKVKAPPKPASDQPPVKLTSSKAAEDAYDAAFDKLRAGNFVESSRGFRAFVEKYPHDKLTPNAWYWLGESYYVTQNYKYALQAFDQVLTRFPQSGKAPGALLKKGYTQYALKQTKAAEQTLQAVIAQYPKSSVAGLAQQRLQDIRLQQQLN